MDLQHSEHVKTIIVLPVTSSSKITATVLALYRTNVTLRFKS
jgi:hypothetical protein